MSQIETQEQFDELYRYAMDQVAAGVNPYQVQQALVQSGWAPGAAANVMDHVRKHSGIAPAQAQMTQMAQARPGTSLPSGAAAYASSLANQSPHTTSQPATQTKENTGAMRDMLVGGLFFFGGLVITVGSLMFGNGGFVLAWGAIIFGGIQFFRGVANAVSN